MESKVIEFVPLDLSDSAREASEKFWASQTRQYVINYCSVKMMPLKRQLAFWERCRAKWGTQNDKDPS
jgi:hypothetical protein